MQSPLSRCLLISLLLAPTMAGAQRIAPDEISAKEQPEGSVEGRVMVDYTEVHAGPGAAYVSRGRVYRDDTVDVRRRNRGGDWIEIVGGGLQGWVRARYLDLFRPGTGATGPGVRRQQAAGWRPEREEGRVDPGRDRRETNYGYDDDGRRRTSGGDPMGSGEGTGRRARSPSRPPARDPVPVLELEPMTGSSDGGALSIWAGVGAAQIKRSFDSNIDQPSVLRTLAARPAGYGLELGASWAAHRYLALRGRGRLTAFAETTLNEAPSFGLNDRLKVSVSALQAELEGVGRYPFGDGWAGLYAGPRLLLHGFQQTEPFPVFLTTSVWSLGIGAAAAYRVGPVDATVHGGLLLPLSISQSPADSGEVASSSGFEIGALVGYKLNKAWAVVVGFALSKIELTFSGASSHADTASVSGQEKTYDQAREADTVAGGFAGARWTL